MSLFINTNNGPIYNECTVNVYNGQTTVEEPQSSQPEEVSAEPVFESIIFTKKAKRETKEASIIEALRKAIVGRKDKTRAFVQELQVWQEDGYIDAHYNAQVMYDELDKLVPLPFGYEVFKKHYNNTRS